MAAIKVHLVDGTYELFRHYYALPKQFNQQGEEIAATRGVVGSLLYMLSEGATHVAVATDHVIESFRNDLWPYYKTGAGIAPDLYSQFELLEEALTAAGFKVWAMTDYEADDALAAGAAVCAKDERVEQVTICTPDKDLAQCVSGNRVVQLDRRKRRVFDEGAIKEKFGVLPRSIPDYLALVGDSADGFPGIPGWGPKAAATLLSRYSHLENIPAKARQWDINIRGADRLAEMLEAQQDNAYLFRKLATLVTEGPVACDVDDLLWRGVTFDFARIAVRLDAPELADRANALGLRV